MFNFNGKHPLCIRGSQNRTVKLTNHKPEYKMCDVNSCKSDQVNFAIATSKLAIAHQVAAL